MKEARMHTNGTNGKTAPPPAWPPQPPAAGSLAAPVSPLIARLKSSPESLRDPAVQEQLRRLGNSRLDRYLLTLQMEQAGVHAPRELWHIIDQDEPQVGPRLSFAEAKALAEDEGDERLVQDLLVLRGFSILGADAKAGKSTLAKNLMAAVLRGQPWLGRQVMQGPVLYFMMEESLAEVIADLEALGVRESDPIEFRRGQIAVAKATETLRGDIEATGAILAVIDPLADILGVESVNDYRVVNRALKELLHVARDTGCHLMAVHHNTKSAASHDAKSFLGSAAIGAATDANLVLQKDRYDVRYLKVATRYRRDVDIPRTVLDYDPLTGRVTLGNEADEPLDPKQAKIRKFRRCFLAMLADEEPLSTTDLDARVKAREPAYQGFIQSIRQGLHADGILIKQRADGKYLWSRAGSEYAL